METHLGALWCPGRLLTAKSPLTVPLPGHQTCKAGGQLARFSGVEYLGDAILCLLFSQVLSEVQYTFSRFAFDFLAVLFNCGMALTAVFLNLRIHYAKTEVQCLAIWAYSSLLQRQAQIGLWSLQCVRPPQAGLTGQLWTTTGLQRLATLALVASPESDQFWLGR